jgi:hypothetical protein
MSPLLLPFQLVLLVFAGWVNRHQLDVIEYLQEENRVLKERLETAPATRRNAQLLSSRSSLTGFVCVSRQFGGAWRP